MDGRQILLAVGLALAFATGAMAADPTPCNLLTLADVQSALGAPWKLNVAFSEGEVCAYTGPPKAVVSLLLTSDPMGAPAILAGRQKLAGDKAKPAAGPGAGAYHVTTPQAIAIVFGKGEYVGQVEASPAATKDWAVLEKLAKAAYDRLP